MRRRFMLKFVAALLPLAAAVSPASAQDYPARTITLVAPFSAGGALDLVARTMADKLQNQFGKPVVVDNKAGAAGIIGTSFVARSAPDGYNLVLGATTTHGINPVLYKNLQYKVTDFAPVSLVATIPHLLVVNPSLPVNNLQELFKLAKEKPLNYGSAGVGSPHHLAGELLKSQFGLDIQHVPYKGSAPALTAVMSGELDFMSVEVTAAMQHIKAGKLRPIAIASAQRNPSINDLPTFAEQGVADFEVTAWYAIFAPKDTPKPVVDKLSQGLAKATSEPDVKERFASLGATPIGSTPEELGRFMDAQLKQWSHAIKISNTPLVE